jgi:hypothetical protein
MAHHNKAHCLEESLVEEAPLLKFTNPRTGFSFSTGTTAPHHSTTAGSLFMMNNGSLTGLYQNISAGGWGSEWLLLDSSKLEPGRDCSFLDDLSLATTSGWAQVDKYRKVFEGEFGLGGSFPCPSCGWWNGRVKYHSVHDCERNEGFRCNWSFQWENWAQPGGFICRYDVWHVVKLIATSP